MKYKTQFYSQVIEGNPNTETAKLLLKNDDCGYYELCQSFLDVALNAPIVKSETGDLLGVFQHTDIAIAKDKAVVFIKNNGIKAIDSFFEILEHEYPFSAAPDDTRRKNGVMKEEGARYNGYMGTLYFFTQISDDVYSDMVAEIKKQLIEDGYFANQDA